MFGFHKCCHPSRRSFLQAGCAGLFGTGLSEALAAAPSVPDHVPTARATILVWLSGGPSTIDMWDMKPSAPAEIRGEFKSIVTSVPGLYVCEHLPELAKVMDRCTLIRSLHHRIPAHGPGAQYVVTGNKPSPRTEFPSLGSLTAHALGDPNTPVAPYFTIGPADSSGAGYLGSTYNPFELADASDAAKKHLEGISLPEGFTRDALARRARIRAAFDAGFSQKAAPLAESLGEFQQRSIEFLRGDVIRKAFDVSQERPQLREAYGRGPLGQNMLVARRLVEFGSRFITVGVPGWDTHANNFTDLENLLLPPLDRALASLIADLDSRGLLDEVIVCCMGEFGRTPRVNRTAGRDHWSSAMSVLVAGGGLARGLVHGETDNAGQEPVSDACTPADLAATLLGQFGIDASRKIQSASGRPMDMVADGRLIHEIVG